MGSDKNTKKHPPELAQAIKVWSKGQQQEGRDLVRDFLVQQPANIDALLWLARMSGDQQEALAAADLALKLDPENEIAKRAVIAVRQRATELPSHQASREALSTAVSLATKMTLAQARAVNWPFNKINRPLGSVLDDGTITLRDLGWAVERAYEEQIREAVRTILLHRLLDIEPQEQPRLLRVVKGSRYTESQERKSLLLGGVMLGGMFLLALELILWSVVQFALQRQGWEYPAWTGLISLGVLIISSIGYRLTWGFVNRFESHLKGRRGEERVIDELRYALDGQWTLYHNLEWLDRKAGDIDLVLVGPGGVWAFEVKAYTTSVRNRGERWEYRGKRRWHRMYKSPGRQATRNAQELKSYLDWHIVNVGWVQAVVVWVGKGELIVRNPDPKVQVWTMEELPEQLDVLCRSRKLSTGDVEKITAVLDELFRELKAKQEKWNEGTSQ